MSEHFKNMDQPPRVQFKTLKGFPADGDKIETETFLRASKEVVSVIETFGRVFLPVISDMKGNIGKLMKEYNKDTLRFHHLEDLIRLNVDIDNIAGDALLWLKRALQLICIFFENIYNDTNNGEVLKKHLQDAYEKTLKPYHGFIVQSTVKIIYSWVPSRTQLIGEGMAHAENIKSLEVYLPSMRINLNKIDALLKTYNLDDPGKV